MENSTFLTQPFKHKNWFVKENKETGIYEPYLSNKLAIQYFAQCGDFYLNKDETAVKYAGKEGGQFTGKQKIEYFKELVLKRKEAEAKAKLIANRLNKENNVLNYIDGEMLIVIKYWSENYSLINVNFLEYLKETNPDFLSKTIISKMPTQ